MPRELVAIAPRQPVLREYEESLLNPGEVRLRSFFSAPKHGTELRGYRGDTKDHTAPFDPERRLHVGPAGTPKFPVRLGNMAVGEVIEVGEGVTGFQIGDRVFGHLPIRETHTVAESRLEKAPDGMSAEAIVYSDPAGVALAPVRDSNIAIGDRVAVLGLGAIGQMALQIARLQGARWIVATDPIPTRRELAKRHGADVVLDPIAEDAGLVIKDQTDKIGVDVSLETSGTYAGLNDALRATGFGGTVVSSAYYTGDARALSLEGEWHRNQLTVISTRDANPYLRNHPLWDTQRVHGEAFALLQEGRLSVEGLIHPIVPFADSAEAYREIDEAPEKSIKLGITYDT
ncbi:MAG: zinc-binding dehydrogenase [Candidatus Poribacteria bacterium]|nr:zinc-binding dehydrogenase [Candidatus Poribacteria bacterium]